MLGLLWCTSGGSLPFRSCLFATRPSKPRSITCRRDIRWAWERQVASTTILLSRWPRLQAHRISLLHVIERGLLDHMQERYPMGLGATGSFYDNIAEPLATFTRVVWYDRAGLGQSDPAPTPRTIQDLVVDLHALLHTANIPAPYVLVGHSLGGLTVRFYREQYPEEVVALVLIDSSHEEQQQRQLAVLPPSQAGESSDLAQLRHAWKVSWSDPLSNEEHIDNLANSELMRTCGTLDSPPSVIIIQGRSHQHPP